MTSTVSTRTAARATRSSRKPPSSSVGRLAAHPPGGLVYRDEEVDSVEADGHPLPDDAAAEKRQLTGMLVTSIVESAGHKKAVSPTRRSRRHRPGSKVR